MIIDKKVVLDDSLSIGQSHTLCHLAWLVGSYDFAQKMSKKVRQNSSGLPFPFLLNCENKIGIYLPKYQTFWCRKDYESIRYQNSKAKPNVYEMTV